MIAGHGGLMGITGTEETPCRVGVALTDITTGLYLHGGILSALYHRQSTGKGQHVHTSLLASQVANLTNVASAYLNKGVEGKRRGTAHPSIVPYQAFPTKDGHVTVGAANDPQFQRLCAVLDTSWDKDARFSTNAQRVMHRDVLIPMVEKALSFKSTEEWMQLLEEANVPCGPVNTMQGVFEDPQVKHLGMVEHVPSQDGTVPLVRHPVDFSESPVPTPNAPPPLLGQHTRSILKDVLRRSEADIDALISSGIVYVAPENE